QGHRGQGRRGEQPGAGPAGGPAQEPRVAEAVSEVRRLFQSAQQPPRWPMYVRQAKQFMRNVDSTFDERKFGFASIVDLLRACQREGLFRIERDRQGVMRLFQGNVMQGADGAAPAEQATTPRAPRPWQPGDDIPDIHESDRETEPVPEVVEGAVVREVETPEILDAQPAEQPAEPEPKKGRGRGGRARTGSQEPKAPRAPRARKTAAAKGPRAARASRAKKTD
ncbi:MAG TPA: OST-HTH/LOTUS domain-containing protein, partial [Vicinamibacterales bacterium]|nr:OST-HTH/LOTUS domain-containing protein [Vicinamibacterales bacterium]